MPGIIWSISLGILSKGRSKWGVSIKVSGEELRSLILAIALENAVEHGGRPSFDAVVKKLIGIRPDLRPRIRELIPLIRGVVDEVSTLSLDEQERRLDELRALLPEVEKPRERVGLPPLPGAVRGRVVTRFAPNPDFVLHLGSLRPLILSYEYARMYDGVFILRFEDTDPRTKRPEKEYYDMILEDIEWLGIKPDKVYYQSLRMELYYDVARRLIEGGYAYVCKCSRNRFSEYVSSGVACPHRDVSPEDNLEEFDRMLGGFYGEGEAVVRIKTDLGHPNPSIREWVALRIIDTRKYRHPLVGDRYIVWPLYNFSVSVDDHYMGITHIFRGEEHRVNEEKQRYIYRYMGWEPPIAIHHGRLAIPGGILSKSKILSGIRQGIYSGVDDLRLATLRALRRRGIEPEALKNIIIKIGLKSSTAVIDWSLIAAENRKIIDRLSNRYYGVREPFAVTIFGIDIDRVEIRRHPDYPEKGVRTISLPRGRDGVELLLDVADEPLLRDNEYVRLIHIGNFRVLREGARYILEYVDNDVKKAMRHRYPFLHWVSSAGVVEAIFKYPDISYTGYIEDGVLGEGVGSHIQLERLGYFVIERFRDSRLVEVIFSHD